MTGLQFIIQFINRFKLHSLFILLFSINSYAYLPNQGDIAPDFSIQSINGENFKLSDYKGKQSVYVVFWNTWCHFCMKKIPKLKAVEKNLSTDIKIIAINTSRDDSLQESLAFQKKLKINYMLAFDNNEVITDLYNVHGVPTEFIIDINGIIQHRDGVPEHLKNHVNIWNKTTLSFTQTIKGYLQLFNDIYQNIKTIS